jgi:hypothetical protein
MKVLLTVSLISTEVDNLMMTTVDKHPDVTISG